MDLGKRFVAAYVVVTLSSFVILTLLGFEDGVGLYVGAYTVGYFILRSLLNPKMKTKFDVLGWTLIAVFTIFITYQVLMIILR